MKVAIVHDYLNQYGGAERVLEEIRAIYPKADIKTAIHDLDRMPDAYRDWPIEASWMNRLPMVNSRHRWFLPAYPHAFESFDLSGYDLVISSSSGFAHGVITSPDTLNVCYCHSPPRFLWDFHSYVRREKLGRLQQAVLSTQLLRLRQWDRVSAERSDAWIATSRLVSDRIRRFYGKDSTIIPPPVNVARFDVGQGPGEYYLMLMRLVGWKRPDIVVQACTQRNAPLVVAGDGRALDDLRAIAGPTVRFVGRVNDAQMRGLYSDCKALILPSEEDFGITPLEAMASGRPVIAYGRGGVLGTVQPGVTGVFFLEQTAASLAEAMTVLEHSRFNPDVIRQHAEGFDSAMFRTRLAEFIDAQLRARRSRRQREPAFALAGD